MGCLYCSYIRAWLVGFLNVVFKEKFLSTNVLDINAPVIFVHSDDNILMKPLIECLIGEHVRCVCLQADTNRLDQIFVKISIISYDVIDLRTEVWDRTLRPVCRLRTASE